MLVNVVESCSGDKEVHSHEGRGGWRQGRLLDELSGCGVSRACVSTLLCITKCDNISSSETDRISFHIAVMFLVSSSRLMEKIGIVGLLVFLFLSEFLIIGLSSNDVYLHHVSKSGSAKAEPGISVSACVVKEVGFLAPSGCVLNEFEIIRRDKRSLGFREILDPERELSPRVQDDGTRLEVCTECVVSSEQINAAGGVNQRDEVCLASNEVVLGAQEGW